MHKENIGDAENSGADIPLECRFSIIDAFNNATIAVFR
jgi:hypothetical protein